MGNKMKNQELDRLLHVIPSSSKVQLLHPPFSYYSWREVGISGRFIPYPNQVRFLSFSNQFYNA